MYEYLKFDIILFATDILAHPRRINTDILSKNKMDLDLIFSFSSFRKLLTIIDLFLKKVPRNTSST